MKNIYKIKLSIVWLLSLILIQALSYIFIRNDAKEFIFSIEKMIQSELTDSRPNNASKALMNFEQVGMIRCTRFAALNGYVPILDLTFKGDCTEDFISLRSVKIETSFVDNSNNKWELSFLKNSSNSFYYSLIGLRILMTLIFFFFIYLNFKVSKYKKELSEVKSINERNRNKVNEALSQTTQMLAHDVRKPFTMVKSLLNIIETTSNSADILTLAKTYLPEVNYAIASVNSMVQDVMEIGAFQIKLFQESASAQNLIRSSVDETFRYSQNADIKLSFSLNSKYQVYVDTLKTTRVLSNIISNAVQALKESGEIWFKTSDIKVKDKNMIEFCIGNSNAYIENEDLEQLFDAFFTKNKKGGTGLGLAIVKKIVNAHGGEIYCKSTRSTGVEFFFTLPASQDLESFDATKFPGHSRELFLNYSETSIETYQDSVNDDFSELEAKLLEEIDQLSEQKLQVFAIDDESIYRNLIEELIPVSSPLRKKIKIETFSSPDIGYEKIINSNSDLVLMDIDLNDPVKSGFDVTKMLRKNNFMDRICIHSNRGTFEYKDEFKDSGADLMIPKPMSQIHFVRLLLSIAKEKNSLNCSHNVVKNEFQRNKHLIILDDSFILRESWRFQVEMEQKSFSTPEELFAEIDHNPSILRDSVCVVTDNDFGNMSNLSGFDVAEKLKKLKYSQPIFLSSNGIFEDDSVSKLFSKKVSKSAGESWEEIQNYLYEKAPLNFEL